MAQIEARPLDSSVLTQIPTYADMNPTGAQEQALNIAGAGQRLQMGGLELAERRQQQKDEAQARTALKGVDPSSFEGMTRALGKIESPQIRMKVMAELQKQGKTQREATIQDMEIADRKLDILARALDPAIAQLELEARRPGMNQAMLDAKTKQLVIPTVLQLQQDHPELADEIKRFLDDPNHLTYQGARSADAQAKWGSEAIKRRLEERRQETSERRETAYERDVASRGADRGEKASERASSLLDKDDLAFTAQQYLAGDKSVFTGLGRGNQGATNIVNLRREVRRQAQAAGMNAGDVAAKMAEFNAIMAEERKVGGIAGGVEFANSELQRFIPLARSASANVSRGSFVPWNRLEQAGEASISDPALKKFYVQTQGVLNAYDVLAARGGTDKEKREQIHKMLSTADSPAAYDAALDAIEQELGAARVAGSEAKRNVAAEVSGRSTTAAPSGATSSSNKPSWAE